jgi:hypothetical protein
MPIKQKDSQRIAAKNIMVLDSYGIGFCWFRVLLG